MCGKIFLILTIDRLKVCHTFLPQLELVHLGVAKRPFSGSFCWFLTTFGYQTVF